MRRYLMLLPLAFAAAGCNDTPAVVTNADTVAQQEAEQKKADEEERNQKGGVYDPSAPKKPGKPKK